MMAEITLTDSDIKQIIEEHFRNKGISVTKNDIYLQNNIGDQQGGNYITGKVKFSIEKISWMSKNDYR